MKTKIVPASELGTSLRAIDHMPEIKLQKERAEALRKFIAARQRYLHSAGWTKTEQLHPAAPQWWRDPNPEPGEQEEYQEIDAIRVQELRDNDVVYQ